MFQYKVLAKLLSIRSQLMSTMSECDSTYVFGYGSLVWKNNDFEFSNKIAGMIKGFKRRFYQNSIDHRGTEEKPGRVATLLNGNVDDKVFGVAYEISKDKAEDVLKYLDYREKNGYERHETIFYPISNDYAPKKTIVYVANEKNVSWNHDHDLQTIATQIYDAVGPSGANLAYVYNLCNAMRSLFPHTYHEDKHLFELEKILKQMEVDRKGKLLNCV